MSDVVVHTDPFRWLEDGESSETRSWLKEQAETLQSRLGQCIDRPRIQRCVTDMLQSPAMDLSAVARDHSAFALRSASDPLPSLYVRHGLNGLFPLVAAPEQHSARTLCPNVLAISPDGQRIAIGMRDGGRDELSARIVRIADRAVLDSSLPSFSRYRTCLRIDLTGYYYLDRTEDSYGLFFKAIVPPSDACLVLQDARFSDPSRVALWTFEEDDYIIIGICTDARDGSDYYYARPIHGGSTTTPLLSGLPPGVLFTRLAQRLLIFTNWHAPMWRILECEITDHGVTEPRTLVPESEQRLLSMTAVGDTVLLLYLASPWSTALKAVSTSGKSLELEGMPEADSARLINCLPSGAEAYFETSGIGQPPTIFRVNTKTLRVQKWFQTRSRYRIPPVETETTWYTSTDGARVPIRLTKRKGLQLTNETPIILTAYGGFGLTETTKYSNRSALWLSMGGVWVHAGIRGGGELGPEWHEQGMRHNKQRSFDDFIAAAEWLIDREYTCRQRLAIVGGSNGGLLVGAALTQRPDLFAAVICFGPLLDMLRFHLFAGSIPGVPEYGSPDDPADFEYLIKYSPYHQVKVGVSYPPVLFISGDADTRCHPMHARKMTARMQHASSSGKPVLLDYHESRGHASLLPLKGRVATLTNQFCFLFQALELTLDEKGQMVSQTMLPTNP